MDKITGKTIAITGAARGIGFATAKALLARGARVVIGDRDVAFQESAVADLTKLGRCRLSARRHRPRVVRHLPRQGPHRRRRPHRRPDQQRGRDADRPFLEQSEQAIRSSIEVNLYGVIAGCQWCCQT